MVQLSMHWPNHVEITSVIAIASGGAVLTKTVFTAYKMPAVNSTPVTGETCRVLHIV